MSIENPTTILIDVYGNPLSVQNGAAIPAGTTALMIAGSDGTNARYIIVDANGRAVVSGAGTAGTPAGGVMSIQGVAGGVALPISGTVTATNDSVGGIGSSMPHSATQIGATDGSNLQAPMAFDTGSHQYVLGTVLRSSSITGSIELGTATNPVRVNPTGTTVQPVSATALPLPTGAAQEHATAVSPSAVRLTDGAVFYKATTPADTQKVQEISASTSALTNVAGSATSVTLLAANPNRVKVVILNDNTAVLRVKYGAIASATSLTYILQPGASITEAEWSGRIDGIWATAGTGFARITEMTP